MFSRKKFQVWFFAAILPIAGLWAQEAGAVGEETNHWHIGISGGYANNWLYTSTGSRVFAEYKSGDGFEIGISALYQFVSWFALQAEIQFIQKNYIWLRTGQFAGARSEVTNSFISLPAMAQFSFGGQRLRGFLNTGGYVGFWANSRRKGRWQGFVDNVDPDAVVYSDFDETVDFDKERDNRFEAGLLAGIGVSYAFKPCTVYLETRFNYGLTDLQKDYMYDKTPRMNNTIAVTMGALFNKTILSSIKRGK
jgi:hypothetical protein